MVKPLQVLTVLQGNQGTLHQRRAAELRPPFGDPAAVLRGVRVAHPRHDPEVRRQLALALEVVDIADDRQQDRGADATDPLDALEILVAGKLLAFGLDRLFQLRDRLVERADLTDQRTDLGQDDRPQRKPFDRSQAFLARELLTARCEPSGGHDVVDLVFQLLEIFQKLIYLLYY